METLGIHHNGFGDLWATVNYALGLGDTRLCRQFRGHDCRGILSKIESLLDTPNHLELIDDPPTKIAHVLKCFSIPYLRTKIKWRGSGSGVICYQLDGRGGKEFKNLSKSDEEELLKELGKRYKLVDIGNMMPLDKMIRHLAGADALVTIPSGTSHVANSVGVPSAVILTDKLLEKAGNFRGYISAIYGGKRNMAFYRGIGPLLSHDFVAAMPFHRRKLIEGPMTVPRMLL